MVVVQAIRVVDNPSNPTTKIGRMTAAGGITRIGVKGPAMTVDMTTGVLIVLGGTIVMLIVEKELLKKVVETENQEIGTVSM